jgi:hypothetical protein
VVSDGTRTRFSLALGIALVIPLAAVPTIAAVALTGDEAARPALAQGSIGGTFHPVAGSFEPDETELADCGADFRCLEQAFGNIAYRRGPKAALTLFDQRIAEDENVAADCHPISHWIGSASLARYRGNVARTFVQGSSSCASGYYHGILERAFAGVSSKAQLAKLAASLCVGEGLRRYGYYDRQCRHGLGHGLMIQTGYDLPTALSLCAGLGTRWDHLTCSNGVFMENASTRFGFRSPWLDDRDPLYPCNQLGSLDRRHCFARVPTQVLTLNGNDFEKVAATCASLARRWVRHCFRGMGRDAVDVRGVPGRIFERCRLAAGSEGDCLYGAARWVTDRSVSEGARGAVALCNAAPPAFRSECFRGIGGVLGLLNPSDAARRRACAKVTRRYVDECTSAAIAEVDPGAREEAWG